MIPSRTSSLSQKPLTETKQPFWNQLQTPWKHAWALLQKKPSFTRFQLGFFFGGAGLMILQPSLPTYFSETLHLSYTDLLFAMAACKGIGFKYRSSTWGALRPDQERHLLIQFLSCPLIAAFFLAHRCPTCTNPFHLPLRCFSSLRCHASRKRVELAYVRPHFFQKRR